VLPGQVFAAQLQFGVQQVPTVLIPLHVVPQIGSRQVLLEQRLAAQLQSGVQWQDPGVPATVELHVCGSEQVPHEVPQLSELQLSVAEQAVVGVHVPVPHTHPLPFQ
jgi:hypothetical protein